MTAAHPPARDERFVLAVDLGTGGPKVGLVSLSGAMAWHDHVAVATSYLDGGGAEQDAEQWWRIVADATRRAVAESGVPARRIEGVSVTGQWASTVPVDAAGRPVAGALMWMDSRGAPYSRQVIGGPALGYDPRRAARWIRRCGVPPSPSGADPVGHMLYLQRARPEIARAARWYLEPVDYLSMRFTGTPAASPASMAAAWLTDTRDPDVRGYDRLLVRLAGVDAAKLPPLAPTGTVIGRVQQAVAAELGIPAGARVVTGTLDLHSAAVAAGAVRDYEAHLVVSTTSWISCPVPRKKTDVLRSIATVPGLTARRYLVVDNQDSAGRALEWLREGVAGAFSGPAPPDYGALLALAAAVPPGSGNVVFTPWLTGEHSPIDDRHARGGFHNVSRSATGAHLVRAVLEGVAYNSRWLLAAVERFTGRRLEPIRLLGGGARSDLWCQILADVLDRRIERVAEPLQANLRGAALFAGVALGALRWDEIGELVRVDATFTPDPANRATYDRLFDEFAKLYRKQKGMFARLNAPR